MSTECRTDQETPRIVLLFDGGSRGNPGPAYGSFALRFPNGEARLERLTFDEILTNNQAEYRTLIAGLEALLGILASRGQEPRDCVLEIRTDSELVARQLQGIYKVRHPQLRPLVDRVHELLRHFRDWKIQWQPREFTYRELGH